MHCHAQGNTFAPYNFTGMKNTFLSILFFTLFACSNQSQNTTGLQLVSANEFSEQLHKHPTAQILDVRTTEEFAGGHLEGAINMNIYDTDFDQRLESLDKSKPVFVYCKAGGRSGDAATRLSNMGFKEVFDMKGGFMAWTSAGLPSSKAEITVAEKFTPADFDKLMASTTPILIDYYAPWCGPCKKMEPVLNQLSIEFNGKIQIVRINVDEAPQVIKQQNIENIPVVSCIKAGKEIKRTNGFQDEQALRAMIAELMQ